MQLLEDQQVTTNAAACAARSHNGTKPCRQRARPGSDWCSYHADVTPEPPQEGNTAPEPASVAVAPEAVLMALEGQLARLRDERDQAENEAATALARANRVSLALIKTSRERSELRIALER